MTSTDDRKQATKTLGNELPLPFLSRLHIHIHIYYIYNILYIYSHRNQRLVGMEFLLPEFSMAQPRLCGHVKNKPVDGKSSLIPTLCVYVCVRAWIPASAPIPT